jgi:hypothetical protein
MERNAFITLSIKLLVTLITATANATDIPANSISLTGNSNTMLPLVRICALHQLNKSTQIIKI